MEVQESDRQIVVRDFSHLWTDRLRRGYKDWLGNEQSEKAILGDKRIEKE